MFNINPFVLATVVLDIGAAAVYLRQGKLWLALVWFCYAIAAFALGKAS